MSEREKCRRCGRPEPDFDSSEYDEWETTGSPAQGRSYLGIICPGCITVAEKQAIDEEYMELGETASRCARCGKDRDFENQEDVLGDWEMTDAGEMVCLTCTTPEEIMRGLESEMRGRLSPLGKLLGLDRGEDEPRRPSRS
jgi:ribosomal protein S14